MKAWFQILHQEKVMEILDLDIFFIVWDKEQIFFKSNLHYYVSILSR